jgi:hypothetical protein
MFGVVYSDSPAIVNSSVFCHNAQIFLSSLFKCTTVCSNDYLVPSSNPTDITTACGHMLLFASILSVGLYKELYRNYVTNLIHFHFHKQFIAL